MSGIGVGLSSSFLWASEGDVRQFFGGWFLDRLGLNLAGVWLFRHRAERCHCSSIHSSIHYMVFARFFHAFEAACLVMSGIGVGLSSSFLWASEGDVRQFFGDWFLDRLGLNPAGVWLFRHRAERRPELPWQLHPQLHPLHGFCIVRRPRCPRGSAPKKPCFGCFGPRPCSQRRRHSIPVLYGGEFWQGLSCCGVSLFRMLAERCSSRPLRATVEHVRWCQAVAMLDDVSQLRWLFFIFL